MFSKLKCLIKAWRKTMLEYQTHKDMRFAYERVDRNRCPNSCMFLGNAFEYGNAVIKANPVKAYLYYALAKGKRSADAKTACSRLKLILTIAQWKTIQETLSKAGLPNPII